MFLSNIFFDRPQDQSVRDMDSGEAIRRGEEAAFRIYFRIKMNIWGGRAIKSTQKLAGKF